jgi:hypothetical protein
MKKSYQIGLASHNAVCKLSTPVMLPQLRDAYRLRNSTFMSSPFFFFLMVFS